MGQNLLITSFEAIEILSESIQKTCSVMFIYQMILFTLFKLLTTLKKSVLV